jgi:hypothetical protein
MTSAKAAPSDASHEAAKESNLPSVGLPRPTGFEARASETRLYWFAGNSSGWIRFDRVRSAEFGTWFGTRFRSRSSDAVAGAPGDAPIANGCEANERATAFVRLPAVRVTSANAEQGEPRLTSATLLRAFRCRSLTAAGEHSRECRMFVDAAARHARPSRCSFGNTRPDRRVAGPAGVALASSRASRSKIGTVRRAHGSWPAGSDQSRKRALRPGPRARARY